MNIKFDITNEPPTPAELADRRREAANQLAVVAKRERMFNLAGYGVGVAGLGVVLLLRQLGLIGDVAVGVAAVAAVAGAAGFTVAVAGAFALVGSLVGAVGVAGAVAAVAAAAGADGFTVAVAGAAAGAVVGMVVGEYLYDRWIDKPRTTAEATLSDLVELEASSMPDQCIDFMQWVDEDATVRAYQQKLMAMERKPVVAEYEAAKVWIATKGQRLSEQERTEQARQACARMTDAQVPT